MLNVLNLKPFARANNDDIKRYYQCLFRRMFTLLLCRPTLLQKMRNTPLHETYEYNLYNNLFLESKKQIHDNRIERYQVYLFDKKKDIVFKCILMIKTDGTIWVDATNVRNKYYRSNVFYRTESTSSKEIANGLIKSLLAWD